MASGVVNVIVTSNTQNFHSERRFPVTISIRDLKGKLELLTGAPANAMKLELRSAEKEFMTEISDDGAHLGDFPVTNGCIIHVIDSSNSRPLDEGDGPKFELADELYDKRTDSVRAWKKKLLQEKPDQSEGSVSNSKAGTESAELANNIKVGQRCEVRLTNQGMAKRGTVMFVGQTDFKPGFWVGVKYDEPLGKHDGTVGGKRYFECPNKYGAFVRPEDVVVGDFPEQFDEGMIDEL